MYQWVIFAHVLSAFIFFIAHGVSAGVALWLRREREIDRVRLLLAFSDASRPVMRLGLAGVLASGIAGGFMMDWWRMGWIWASLVLVVVISAGMMAMGTGYFNQLRKAVGSPYREGGRMQAARTPVPAAELDALLRTPHTVVMALIGIGGMVVIVYLMMFKPF